MKCNVYKKCGSCQYINTDYNEQLAIKHKDYQSLYKDFKCQVYSVVGMKHPYGYRNKVIVAFNNNYEYGLYEENNHKIVPTQHCLLHDEQINHVLKIISQLLKKYRVSIYDPKKNRGFLRHVLIRRAVMTNQLLVCIVATDQVFKGSKNFSNELIKAVPEVKTIVLNINKRQTSIVLSKEEKILYGKGFIVDELCGLTFKISAQSFYQINHEQCENLYNKVVELVMQSKHDNILDTYCGIGTIGMVLAKEAKNVIGVELNKEAYKDALNNARMNKIDNITFVNADATEYMKKEAAVGKHVDCVIMDPPRSGSTKEFIQAVKVMNPKSVVYVSCDPHTQVRDLHEFKKMGYHFKEVYLYDMFPHTKHVETVCLLSKK